MAFRKAAPKEPSFLELWKKLQTKKLSQNSFSFFLSSEAYFRGLLKKHFIEKKYEVFSFDFAAKGPSAAFFDSAVSLGLFSTQKVFFIELLTTPSKWPKNSLEKLKRILQEQNNFEDIVFLFFLAPKIQKKSIQNLKSESYSLESFPSDLPYWLKFMNEKKKASLSVDKLRFLSELEVHSLVELENYMELWSLGGDLWAKRTLLWGATASEKGASFQNLKNPSFSFVDALLEGNSKRALELWSFLKSQSVDLIPLVALSLKSIRMLSNRDCGDSLSDQNPYLAQKIKSLRVSPERSLRLLKSFVELDHDFKSSFKDSESAFMKELSAL